MVSHVHHYGLKNGRAHGRGEKVGVGLWAPIKAHIYRLCQNVLEKVFKICYYLINFYGMFPFHRIAQHGAMVEQEAADRRRKVVETAQINVLYL